MNGLATWLGAAAVGLLTACSAAPVDGGAGDATENEELGVNGHGQFCGGFGGLPCPDGYACVDDRSDSCDPSQGGADCGGVCVREKKPKRLKCQNDPDRVYVGTSAEECATIKFFCAEGVAFADDCGCGCDTGATTCGASVCGAGEYCCNESCGLCAPEGGFCIQQFCGELLCTPEDCGPQLGLANYLCPDGVSVAGPTGVCQSTPDGCGWEILSCPAN
jgi:hypothetical protein